MTSAASPPRQPHIVMLSGNDVAADTRIRKTAISAARLGARVTLVAYASDGVRSTRMLGPVTLIRIPVPWRCRDARTQAIGRRRTPPVLIGYRSATEEQAARTRARMEFSRAGLRRRRLGRRRWQAAGQWIRVRRAGQRVIGIGWTKGWRVWDGLLARTRWPVSWGRVVPQVYDYEAAYAAVIDSLAPDLIHSHDADLLLVADNAARRAQRAGRAVPWIYDAHEYVRGLSLYGGRTARVRAAWASLEKQVIGGAAGVITVSPAIADRLAAEHSLPHRPTLTLNTPLADESRRGSRAGGVREQCGLGDETPLLVYSGGVTAARGVQTAIAGLADLPGVHLAVVCVPHPRTHAVQRLVDQAAAAGVSDRVHFLDPVQPRDVVPFLSSGDIGLLPLLHFGSHDMALTNKLFEYLHAGLPIVASDCRTQAEFLAATRIGEVHRADDPASFVAAVSQVLGALPEYRSRVGSDDLRRPYTWEAQEVELAALYRRLLPDADWADPATLQPLERDDLSETTAAAARLAEGQRRLVIGPANMAGQAWAWAQAVRRAHPEVQTEVLAVEKGGLDFPADERVPPDTWAKDLQWQQRYFAHLCDTATHVLLEAGRPIAGLLNGRTFLDDALALRSNGLEVAAVFHGSEVRDPARHRRQHRHSPYADPGSDLTTRLTRVVAEMQPLLRQFDGPMFVSTPDLLEDVPGATWLPVVVDIDAWRSSERPLGHEGPPVVLHAPSRSSLKGSDAVDRLLHRLHAEGLVEYRRLEGVAPDGMPAVIGGADIVLDQFALGSYGVLACEALAAGRCVVGHVTDAVRRLLPEPLPIVEADIDGLEQVLRRLVAEPAEALQAAESGPGYVERVHSGALSAAALAPFLGL